MLRRTKIVATLGPASERPKILRKMVNSGLDVARLNFSHGSADEHRKRARHLRKAADDCGRDVGLLGDLQGPKIRVGTFPDGAIDLEPGSEVSLVAGEGEGSETEIPIAYLESVDLFPGATFAIGPPVENGFYYDFELPDGATFTPDDLERIEARMREIVARDEPVTREVAVVDGALQASCLVYGGKMAVTVAAGSGPVVRAVLPGARSPDAGRSTATAAVEDVSVELADDAVYHCEIGPDSVNDQIPLAQLQPAMAFYAMFPEVYQASSPEEGD